MLFVGAYSHLSGKMYAQNLSNTELSAFEISSHPRADLLDLCV